ncbi:pentapeptide repeat-containing protein [Bdellovibrionota bacterium FG-2]
MKMRISFSPILIAVWGVVNCAVLLHTQGSDLNQTNEESQRDYLEKDVFGNLPLNLRGRDLHAKDFSKEPAPLMLEWLLSLTLPFQNEDPYSIPGRQDIYGGKRLRNASRMVMDFELPFEGDPMVDETRMRGRNSPPGFDRLPHDPESEETLYHSQRIERREKLMAQREALAQKEWEDVQKKGLQEVNDRRNSPFKFFKGGKLDYATLSDVNFGGHDLNHVTARNVAAEGLKLRDTVLDHSDWSGAILIGADLSLVKSAKGAKFRDAKLRGACLCGVDLSQADLSGADLSGAIFDENTRLPFSAKEGVLSHRMDSVLEAGKSVVSKEQCLKSCDLRMAVSKYVRLRNLMQPPVRCPGQLDFEHLARIKQMYSPLEVNRVVASMGAELREDFDKKGVCPDFREAWNILYNFHNDAYMDPFPPVDAASFVDGTLAVCEWSDGMAGRAPKEKGLCLSGEKCTFDFLGNGKLDCFGLKQSKHNLKHWIPESDCTGVNWFVDSRMKPETMVWMQIAEGVSLRYMQDEKGFKSAVSLIFNAKKPKGNLK